MKKWMKIAGLLLLTVLAGTAVNAIPFPGDTNTYTLIVHNGSGGKTNCTSGERIDISADVSTGQTFVEWVGAGIMDTEYLDSIASATTTVTMLANVEVTATYSYALTVSNGTGDGSYTNGQQVTITANAPATGKTFDQWIGDTQVVANVTSATTTVTMPTNPITLTATYKDVYYTLTVNNGSGGGTYTNGTQVAISANAPPTGTAFDKWTGNAGALSSNMPSTTVNIPASNVTLTATYTNLPGHYTLTVNSGAGGGAYTNEARVLITPSNAPMGQAFDRWIGDTTQLVNIVTSPSNTVIMTNEAATLTATYTNLPGWYTLTVNRGSGGGIYTNGTSVPITASNAPTRQAFDRWTGDTTQLVDSVTSPSNTVIMPTNAVRLTATYTNLPGYYTLIVNNGTGSGSYTNGTQVRISANPTNGKVFYRWTGAIQYVARADSSPTHVTMPAWAITLSVSNRVDTNLPTVKISSPAAKAKILATNGLFTIRGTATDNKVVTDVLVKLNDADYVSAEMTDGKNWSLPVELIPGVNTVLAYSVDSAFNSSLVSTVTCTYAETTLFTIQTNGVGKVELSPKGPTEIGETYTLKASPASGSAFVNWTGDMPSTNWSIMFTMAPDKTAIANFIDIQKPTVAITYPATKKPQRIVADGTVVLRGTAADNYGLDRVMYQLSTGAWTNAVTSNGKKNWTADFYPITGLNTARVYSVDVNGYTSSISTVVFTYVPGAVMQVQTNGRGTITPAYNGQVLEIGASYKMTAKAAKNSSVFTGWTHGIGGSVATNKTAITFVMQSNLVLTANFRSLLERAAMADTAIASVSTKVIGLSGSMEFGSVQVGNTSNRTLTVSNSGNTALTVTNISYPACFSGAWSGTIGAGASTNLVVTFTPVSVTNYSGTVTVSSDAISGTNSIEASGEGVVPTVPVITTVSPLPAGAVGSYYSQTLAAIGGTPPYNWSLFSASLPAGLSLNGAGVISGTPEATGTMNFVVRVTDTNNLYATKTFRVTITATNTPTGTAPVIMTASSLPSGTVGSYYSQTLAASGGTPPYNWSLYSACLPAGLSLNGAGVISGTPKAAGTMNFVVRVTGSNSLYSTKTFRVTMTTPSGADITKPTLKIAAPAAKAKILAVNGLFTVRGTAADNSALTNVLVQLNGGTWTNAFTTNGWRNWNLPVTLVPGMNTIRAYSVDSAVNNSLTSTVVFTYVPGAIMEVQVNGDGSVSPAYNGQVLEIGKRYKMTAKAVKNLSTFTEWTYSLGADIVTSKTVVTFVMQPDLVLTANFSSTLERSAMADIAVAAPATPQAAIVVDGASKDWTGVPRSSFSYASATQEVAVALDGNNIALLLNGCPFNTTDNVLVYFKLNLTYGSGDNRHSVDLWTSGSVLYGMVDGKVITGLEAVLLNGVLEVKLPVEQAPSQVTIEEIGGGMDLGGGTLTELFKISPAMQ